MRRHLITALLIVVIAMLLTIVMSAGGSAGGTLSTGRTVLVYSDSLFLSATFSSDTATIKTGGKTIVVEPKRLVVDGRAIAPLNEQVSNVQVRVKRGTITFVADGKPVRTSLP